MAKQKIVLKIAGKGYSFSIESEKEEVYRLAAKEVDACVARFARLQQKDFTVQDCLALAAVQFAISSIFAAQSREVGNEDVKALEALCAEVDTYLNK